MSRVGETGVGEMGIGETGVGEMGVGETGPNRITCMWPGEKKVIIKFIINISNLATTVLHVLSILTP